MIVIDLPIRGIDTALPLHRGIQVFFRDSFGCVKLILRRTSAPSDQWREGHLQVRKYQSIARVEEDRLYGHSGNGLSVCRFRCLDLRLRSLSKSLDQNVQRRNKEEVQEGGK